MRNLLGTSDNPDLVDRANLGTEASVDAEDLAINNGGKHEEIKDLAACLPHRRITILLLALFVESVYLRDLPRLVITSHEDDSIRVSTPVSAKGARAQVEASRT